MENPNNDPQERQKLALNGQLQNLYYDFSGDTFDLPNPEKEAEKVENFIEIVARTRLIEGYPLSKGQLEWLIDNKIAPILRRNISLAGTNEEIFWAAVDKKQAELLAASNREAVANTTENKTK